ncbi:MAG: xylulokinase, partial [Verrucomicrobiales bacterium]|nr:xylulokinase [Verrucomicrobiales bacterium]
MLFLGIDSGTQSTKAIVLDLNSGKILASGSKSYSLIPGLPAGHLEQDPQVWLTAVEASIKQCLKQIGPKKKDIRGIGVSGQQHGLVALDAKDQVVRPAKLWCDTSTQTQCEEIAHEFGGQPGVIHLAGNAMLPGYTIPKVLWMKQKEPKNFAKTKTILLPHDYINFWLSGVKRMEYGDASGMGILNVRTREWCDDLINFIDPRVREMLPPLGSSREAQGTLRPELAKKWGLGSDVVISAGGGDNMMGAIGTGNIKPGVVTASFGTSGTLYGVSATPVVDGQGEVAAFCDSTDQWLPLVCTMNVTVVTEQIRNMFGWDHKKLESSVKSIAPGADGLLMLPYLNGERTPNLPNGTG